MCRTCILKKEWWKEMGAGPIEDAATKAVQLGGDAGPKNQNGPDSDGYFGAEAVTSVPPFKPEISPEEEIIKAQHLFIESLLDFIHNPSKVPELAGAQELYIRAQMKFTKAKLDQK